MTAHDPSSTESRRLLVTVLSGSPGAGKTALLQHILRHGHARRIAVLTHDGPGPHDHGDDCPCCTAHDDLRERVGAMARTGDFDHLVLESAATTEPMPVAESFLPDEDDDAPLDERVRLDTMVTVVDASTFLDDYRVAPSLVARGLASDEHDERTLTDLLVAQVEFANVLVVNKCDLVDEATAREVEGVLRALNPGAEILRAVHGEVPVERLLGTGRFDFDAVERSAGWQRELEGDPPAGLDAYDIRSLVFRCPLPFHPQRLWQLLHDERTWTGILRSRGFFWVASAPHIAYELSQAGGVTDLRPAGHWSTPWPLAPTDDPPNGHPRYGDRVQELVFIGQHLDVPRLRRELQLCLLDPSLDPGGGAAWRDLPNPFPTPDADDV